VCCIQRRPNKVSSWGFSALWDNFIQVSIYNIYTYLSHEEYELQDEPVLKQSSGRFTSGMGPIRVLQPFSVIVGQPEVKSGATFKVLMPCRHVLGQVNQMQELLCGTFNRVGEKKGNDVRQGGVVGAHAGSPFGQDTTPTLGAKTKKSYRGASMRAGEPTLRMNVRHRVAAGPQAVLITVPLKLADVPQTSEEDMS
jgi:hypothetical protein